MTTMHSTSRPTSFPVIFEPVNRIYSAAMTPTTPLERLGETVDLSVFQELLNLDTTEDNFSKEVVKEFLVLAPETLASMEESILERNMSRLGFKTQYLRCASMVLGLTRIEKACARIETILTLGVDLYYTGIGLAQICDILSFVVKDARTHSENAKVALEAFYSCAP